MALSYLAQENFTHAMQCYDTTHTIFLQRYGLGSIELAGLHCRIAECYRQQRDLTHALALYDSKTFRVALEVGPSSSGCCCCCCCCCCC